MKKFDINKLNNYIDNNWIFKQTHPEYDLSIYNYSALTQYEMHWDEITLACRGLVLDSNGNVIARGFNKFFNASEHNSPYLNDLPINLPFTITTKMDGSLFIVFKYKNELLCASRGSFTSEQAIKGKEILSKKKDIFKEGYTYLFELIYPENRIVVNYGSKEDIVLLGIVETLTGKELPYNQLKNEVNNDFEIVKQLNGVKDFEQIKELISDNEEGYVVTFSNGLKVKIKGDEYLRLHRLLTQFSSRSIWELLRFNKNLDELLERVPDEFYSWVKNIKEDLENQYKNILNEVLDIFSKINHLKTDRKSFAIEVMTNYKKHFGFIFLLLDGNLLELNDSIWKSLRPDYETPFKKLSEDGN